MQAIVNYNEPARSPRFSRAVWLADIVRERIFSGVYKPSERIREASLQEEFGFSNGPIREALQILVADGLLERAAWRGVRVVNLSTRQIFDLLQLRAALLEFAAELAARRADPTALADGANLRQGLVKRDANVREGDHPLLNDRFTRWIVLAAGNSMLDSAWNKTVLQTRMYVVAAFKGKRTHRIDECLLDLIDQILAGDVAKAREAARLLSQEILFALGIADQI
jgi:DNA-binding GntR family transcriptional regulator